jgi:hypothetical protein
MLIAATVLAEGAVLVTANKRGFAGLPVSTPKIEAGLTGSVWGWLGKSGGWVNGREVADFSA